ncbi:ATP-binding protein [Ectobacillus ponti]|uniref:histidine kinase n=1 Tax=Ectobacillus ponti TaxID=2961894 RepID=A0AA41X9W2_9BACI|nr:ATP-binding protein [Ectobacillus ponti]MCP8968086.1 ATP-binding protein [Ectobacillus ponti]
MRKKKTLFRWIWHAYAKSAIIPLIVIELAFLAIYFTSNSWIKNKNQEASHGEAKVYLQELVGLEAKEVQKQLQGVSNLTRIYQKQTEAALKSPEAVIPPEDAKRLAYAPNGAYYTTSGRPGGSAVFYSGYVPVGAPERQKLAKLLPLQGIMKDLQESDPLVASIYFNTYDSLNIIYPYFSVLEQYPSKMDIATYNFYYEADAAHNPEQRTKWTDVYLDPAGHGWMASSIAPVYNGSKLEGVVGLDITVDTIIKTILKLHVPWNGYALLVGKDGTIIGLPETGEKEWKLQELTSHQYKEAVQQDTTKPDEFNIYKRKDTDAFASSIRTKQDGALDVTFNKEQKVVSWTTIPETGWKLLVMVPESEVYKDINLFNQALNRVGTWMTIGLVIFYLLFFAWLYRRAKAMSFHMAGALSAINRGLQRIVEEDYRKDYPELQGDHYDVVELEETASLLGGLTEELSGAKAGLLEANAEIQQRERELRALVNSIDDVILVLNEKGYVLNILTQQQHRFRTPIEELVGRHLSRVIGEETSAAKILEKCQAAAQANSSEVLDFSLAASGLYYQARISPIQLERQEMHFAVVIHETTEQRKAQLALLQAKEEAEKANRAKSQFLSQMSHELRTPLNAILGFAQILEMDPLEPLQEGQKESVTEIYKAGNHLLDLINEILDLAKIEAGKVSLELEPVDYCSLMAECKKLIQPLAQKRGIAIAESAAGQEALYVQANEVKLKQVLLNLLSNAVKYNREQGSIEIRSEVMDGTRMRVSVADTGYGVPLQDQERIFEPFQRYTHDDRFVEGTGIGLTVSKQLIQLMGGSIGVESEEGVGSTFWIELPLQQKQEQPPAEQEDALAAPISKGTVYRILYIEDTDHNMRLVDRILKGQPDLELIGAKSGWEGLQLIEQQLPDVILTDIHLPDIDGFEILQHMKLDGRTKDIPVIAVSANAMPQDIERGMQMGFYAYLTKPLRVRELLQTIRDALQA